MPYEWAQTTIDDEGHLFLSLYPLFQDISEVKSVRLDDDTERYS